MTDDMRRLIVTKPQIYDLDQRPAGVRLQKRDPGLPLPDWLKDAKIYQRSDGPVIPM